MAGKFVLERISNKAGPSVKQILFKQLFADDIILEETEIEKTDAWADIILDDLDILVSKDKDLLKAKKWNISKKRCKHHQYRAFIGMNSTAFGKIANLMEPIRSKLCPAMKIMSFEFLLPKVSTFSVRSY